jgi:hypothetical protein
MGVWRIEQGIYGEQERWVPGFPGDWPSDSGFEKPCPTCGSDLYRRKISPNRRRIQETAARNAAIIAACEKRGDAPPVMPEPERLIEYYAYEARCYIRKHQAPKEPAEVSAPRRRED